MPHARSSSNTFAAAFLAVAIGAMVGCQHTRPTSPAAPNSGKERIAAPTEPQWAAGQGQSLDAEELKTGRASRVEELFAGRFAGVQVFRYPGGISVRIRGTSSLLGSNEPLYVIDGMPVAAAPGGALLGINPYDIERIEVLKDIGSTSFYGVQGANGVVLITTKRPR